jgi:tRNA A-37 threonylcarbamoyl transferase component Bud32
MSKGAKLHTFSEGGILWTVNEEHGHPLERSLLNGIESLSRETNPVKQNMYRSVYLFHPNGAKGGIYVKKYSQRDWKARLLSMVASTQAQREWRMMLELRERGLPVPLPLAMGQKRDGVELTEYLLTQEIPDCRPIRDCTQWEKDTLLKAIALLTTKLHKNNIFLKDFQLGNILLSTPAGARHAVPLLYLLDLHSARCVTSLSLQQKIWMLAKLLDSFEPFFRPQDKERFLELYARGMPDFRNKFSSNVQKVKSLADKIRRTHLKSRTQRCLRDSTAFAIEDHSGWKVYRRRGLSTEEVFKLLRNFESPVQEGVGESPPGIKTTHKTHLKLLEGERGKICVKHYWCSGTVDYLKGHLGLSRARRAWVIGNGLVVRGVATAEPLALVESPEEAFLLSQALTDFPRLDYYILENFREKSHPETIQKKKSLVHAMARTIRLFHDKEIYHGDLKACNILVEEPSQQSANSNQQSAIYQSSPLLKGDLGTWQFYLIDYDRVVFDREISLRRRAKNLAQLHTSIPWCITRSDRMRFYREYSKGLGLDKKPFLRKVLQFSANRIPVLMEPIE